MKERDTTFRCPGCGGDESLKLSWETRAEDGSMVPMTTADFDNYQVGNCRKCGEALRFKHALIGRAHE